MEPFKPLKSDALRISQMNVDTDQIVPARYLRKPRSSDFGEYLFHDVPQLLDGGGNAKVLVAGRNFACGSSREHAVWALYDYGFRAVIAPSFGDIFFNNSFQNAFLPIVQPIEVCEALRGQLDANPGAHIVVDLEAQTVAAPDG